MSKANGATEKKESYLQHVSVKNYKSIKDLQIDFKPGLNIIIGKNASGKTNFVNGLNRALNLKYDELIDTESSLTAFFYKNIVEIVASNDPAISVDFSKDYYYDPLLYHLLTLNVNDVPIEIDNYDDLKDKLSEYKCFFNPVLIKYGSGYTENSKFISIPFSFVIINNDRISRELMTVTSEGNRTDFLLFSFHRFYMFLASLSQKGKLHNENLKQEIITFSTGYFQKLNCLIYDYSPIEQIRLNPDFNIITEESTTKQIISNFQLEFLIDKNWVTFNLLSDGTKRLFYIISELCSSYYTDNDTNSNNELNIFLIEEPELGIHPHQLHQLMQFIKEQSREKQIIITTHSPQVLDILRPDELDRVIICHSDPQKGTQLTHLTEHQINKAKKYMKEEAFLSDYWRFSDLEPAS